MSDDNYSPIPAGADAPTPILNAESFAARPTGWAVVTETSKSAMAAEDLLPACAGTTVAGGCEAFPRADWSPLYKCDGVILWPNNDLDSIETFNALAAHLREHAPAQKLRIINPSGAPKGGWNALDAKLEGFTPASLKTWAKNRTSDYTGAAKSPWKRLAKQPKKTQTAAAERTPGLRVPPHSIDAEQAVLGGLMLSPEAWDRVSGRLNEDDFYRKDHRLIFRAIAELSNKKQPCDAVTLGEWFESHDISGLVGGTAYILQLANTTPSAANITAYCDIVSEKAALRRVIDVAANATKLAFDRSADPGAIVDSTVRALSDAAERQGAPATAPAWGEPQDFFNKPVLPQLKPDHLPAAIRNYVFDQSAIIGSDPGITALSALVTTAGVADKQTILEMTRTIRRPWRERPVLWGLWIAGSGSKKTAAMLAGLEPAKEIDLEWSTAYLKQMEDFNIELKVHKECEAKYIKARAKAAMSGGGFSSRVAPPNAPHNRRIISDNATVEALSDIARVNPRGLLIPQDELQGWFGKMDAYNKGNGIVGKDKERWLNAYGGGSERIDRVGKPDVIVPNWALCVMGGSQPDMFRQLSAKLPEDGLIQRFMVIMARDALTGDESIDDTESFDRYNRMLRNLSTTPAPTNPIKMSDEGHKEREWMERDIQGTVGMAQISPRMKSHISKLSGLFGRLCLTFHLADAADKRMTPAAVVTGATARCAADFIREYLVGHIRSFYDDLLSESKHRQHAKWIAGYILSRKLTEIDNRRIQQSYDAWEGLPDWTRESAMRMLEDGSWLSPVIGTNPGRRTNRWSVNPVVHLKFPNVAEQERTRRLAEREAMKGNLIYRELMHGKVQE